jgi:hypothetical protein
MKKNMKLRKRYEEKVSEMNHLYSAANSIAHEQ